MASGHSCQWRLGDKTLQKLPPAFSALKDEPDLLDPNTSLSENLETLQAIGKTDSLIATDCKSLYDLISRTAPPACQEFRTLLQARLIKEHLAASHRRCHPVGPVKCSSGRLPHQSHGHYLTP